MVGAGAGAVVEVEEVGVEEEGVEEVGGAAAREARVGRAARVARVVRAAGEVMGDQRPRPPTRPEAMGVGVGSEEAAAPADPSLAGAEVEAGAEAGAEVEAPLGGLPQQLRVGMGVV